jgi:MoxR-like ATPase
VVGGILLLGEPGTGKTALAQAAATHGGWEYRVITATPDHTKDSLLTRFVGEGKGLNGTAFGYGALSQAVHDSKDKKILLCIDEYMLLQDGVKPITYPLMDGNHWLPEANIDGSAMEIPDNFRLIVTSNPQVRGASLPEPIASRFASTTITVETSGDMLRALAIDESVVAAWESLGVQGLWRPQIREIRLADYWLPVDVTQAVSAFLPEHCPESQRASVRDVVVGFLGGDIRNDGRLVVS